MNPYKFLTLILLGPFAVIIVLLGPKDLPVSDKIIIFLYVIIMGTIFINFLYKE